MSPAAFLESFPVQANLFLWHEDYDDACDAVIATRVALGLRSIDELYEQFYGSKDEIILNLFHYFQDQPNQYLSVRYFPD